MRCSVNQQSKRCLKVERSKWFRIDRTNLSHEYWIIRLNKRIFRGRTNLRQEYHDRRHGEKHDFYVLPCLVCAERNLKPLAGDGGLTRLVADKAELRDVRDGTVYLVGGRLIDFPESSNISSFFFAKCCRWFFLQSTFKSWNLSQSRLVFQRFRRLIWIEDCLVAAFWQYEMKINSRY